MYSTIEDVKIANQDGQLCLSFTASSTSQPNVGILMKQIFDDMIEPPHTTQIDPGRKGIEGKTWQELDEDLVCHLDSTKSKIEIKDLSSNHKSSALLLVPAILFSKDIISEQQKDLLHTLISQDPLVKSKNDNPEKADNRRFAKEEAARIFGKKPRS